MTTNGKPVLSERQERFAQHVAAGMPASRAYRAAGFKATGNGAEVNASKLLRIAKVAARIRELRREHAASCKLDAAYVIGGLRVEAETAPYAAARVRALELVGKRLALFTDKVQVEPVALELSEVTVRRQEPVHQRNGVPPCEPSKSGSN